MKNLDKIKEFIGVAKYDEWGGGYIWGVKKGETQMLGQLNKPEPYQVNEVLSVRGWGAIQNMFNNKKEACEFQDDLGKFIADAINEKLERCSNKYNIKEDIGNQLIDIGNFNLDVFIEMIKTKISKREKIEISDISIEYDNLGNQDAIIIKYDKSADVFYYTLI